MADADGELLQQASSGDDGAFRALYERHRRPLFRFVYRMLGSVPLAEDVAHECFVVLLTHPGLPFGREADGWMRHLVTGWRLSGIATGQSDGPLDPGDARLDAALTKRVPGSGQRALELRVEGFNLTNSRRFAGPSGELGRERAVRLGARLTF